MEVILLRDLAPLGSRGDTVRVKPGYARNYLFPRKLAILATPGNRRVFEEEEKLLVRRDRQAREDAHGLAQRLAEASCTFTVRVGEGDRLYGSVSAHDIAQELAKQGFQVDKRQVELEEPIKKLGVYTVLIRLHREVAAPVKIWVVKE